MTNVNSLLFTVLSIAIPAILAAPTGWCGRPYPNLYSNNNSIACGSEVASLDPLSIAPAVSRQNNAFASDGSLQFGFKVCQLNPQGFTCSGGYGTNCTQQCQSYSYQNGTGRGQLAVTFNLTDSAGNVVAPSATCPYFINDINSTCSGACALPVLTVPASSVYTDCGFSSSQNGGNTVETAFVKAVVTEYFIDVTSNNTIARQVEETVAYSMAFPNTITLTSSGFTIYDSRVLAQIKSAKLNSRQSPATATVDVVITVQSPLNISSISATSTDNANWPITLTNPTAPCGSPSGPCSVDSYTLSLTVPNGACTWDSSIVYSLNITLGCRPGTPTDQCPIIGTVTTSVTFSFATLDFCPTPINVVPASGLLLTYTDGTFAQVTTVYLVGDTVYGRVDNFTASAGGSPVSVTGVSLTSGVVVFGAGPTTVQAAASVISCTPTACAFSAQVPTSSTQMIPAPNSNVVLTLTATFTLTYQGGARRRDVESSGTVSTSASTLIRYQNLGNGNPQAASGAATCNWNAAMVFFFSCLASLFVLGF